MPLYNKISLLPLIRAVIFFILFLFATSAHAAAQEELIVNGGFENGTSGWTLSGAVVTSGGNQHAGTRYAVLGEINNGTDLFSQVMTVPANAGLATASFHYYIYTEESTTDVEYDTLEVDLINLTTGTTYPIANLSNLDGGTCTSGSSCYEYLSKQIDLTDMDGDSIQIRFRSTMDSSVFTSFKIDDVSLLVNITDETSGSAPTAVTNSATNITSSSATLGGTVNPNGLSTEVNFLWRKPGQAASPTNLYQDIGDGTSPVSVSTAISGLDAGTQYEFQVYAVNEISGSLGAWETFNTPAATQPQCSDDIDNDGDGLIDYPDDPDCSNADDTSEAGFFDDDDEDSTGNEVSELDIEVSDSPDPFTPSNGETNTITVTNVGGNECHVRVTLDTVDRSWIHNYLQSSVDFEWDGRDSTGSIVSPGEYPYTAECVQSRNNEPLTLLERIRDFFVTTAHAFFSDTETGTITVLGVDTTTVTYYYNGALNDSFGSLSAGTPFVGSVSYEVPQTNLDDGPSDAPYRAKYRYNSLSLTIGGTTVTDNGSGFIGVFDHGTYDSDELDPFGNPTTYPTDLFSLDTSFFSGIVGGQELENMYLVLQDTTGTAWSSTALPGEGLTMADLTAGNATFIELRAPCLEDDDPSTACEPTYARGEIYSLNNTGVEMSVSPICDLFTANPPTITKGESTTLTWESSNAVDAVIDNGVGTVPVDGSTFVQPQNDTTYTATFTGEGDEAAVCSVDVAVDEPEVYSSTFIANELVALAAYSPIYSSLEAVLLSGNAGPNELSPPQTFAAIVQHPENGIDRLGTSWWYVSLGDRMVWVSEEDLTETDREEIETQMLTNVEAMQDTIASKLGEDVEELADAFTAVRDRRCSTVWADYASGFLSIPQSWLSVVGSVNGLGETTGLLANAKGILAGASLAPVFSSIEKAGGQLSFALAGPIYVPTVEAMLEHAEDIATQGFRVPFCFSLKKDVYNDEITNSLLIPYQDRGSPFDVFRPSGSADGGYQTRFSGSIAARRELHATLDYLIAYLRNPDLDYEPEIVAVSQEIDRASRKLIESRTNLISRQYRTYIETDVGWQSDEIETLLGVPAQYSLLFPKIMNGANDGLVIRQRSTIQGALSSAVGGLISNSEVAIGTELTKLQSSVALGTDVAQTIIDYGEIITEWQTLDPETVLYELPQAWMLSMSGEYTNVFATVDGLVRFALVETGVTDPTLPKYFYEGQTISIFSPGEVRARDEQGRVTGKIDGQVMREIPNSEVIGSSIVLYDADLAELVIHGTDVGTYGLRIMQGTKTGLETQLYFPQQSITGDAIHTFDFADDETTRLQIDEDGDGVSEIENELSLPLIDTHAPSTTVALSGQLIADGVFLGDVKLALSAIDNPGGSGVLSSFIALDGITTWQEYERPLDLIEEKNYRANVYSTDVVGNQEPSKVTSFEIVSARGLLEEVLASIERDKKQKAAARQISNALRERFWEDRNTVRPNGGQSVIAHLENAIKFLAGEEYTDERARLELAQEILQEHSTAGKDTAQKGQSGDRKNK